MNKVLNKNSVEELKKYEKILWSISPLSNGHHPTEDAMIKWCSIIDAALEIDLKYEKILDAGCGPSNLSLILKESFPTIDEIFCIDRERISPLLTSSSICKCFQGDFFEQAKNIPDESLDLIIDACSVTHFDTNSNVAANDGCHRLAKEATRILKKEGFFISVSDFSLLGNTKGEFIDIESMIQSYESGGLKIFGTKNLEIDMQNVYISNRQLNLGIVRLIFNKNVK